MIICPLCEEEPLVNPTWSFNLNAALCDNCHRLYAEVVTDMYAENFTHEPYSLDELREEIDRRYYT